MRTNTTTRKGRILQVRVLRKVDEGPDLSYLGDYSNDPSGDARTIDREARRDMGRNEYRYFIAANDHTDPAAWEHVPDNHVNHAWLRLPRYVRMAHPEATTRAAKIAVVGQSYIEDDYRRAEAGNRGEWYMLGVVADAQVTLAGSDVVQRLTSGGLWGIESDSGEDYFAEVEAEQLDELRDQLTACGFGTRAIEQAFKEIER